MDKKIISNFIYNIGYQILILLLPIVTTPYISRIFESKYLGIYSSTASLVQMFILIGMFGIGAYGSKEIAKSRDNKSSISESFSNIYTMQIIMLVTSLFIYIILCLFVTKNTSEFDAIYFIQAINIVASVFDISWLFIGIENMKKVVTRNICVKLGSFILIIIFIKEPSDIYLYTLLLAASNVIGNLSMWIGIKKYISKISLKTKLLKSNLVNSVLLLIPQISYQIYTSFDRTILSYVNTLEEVGYFDQSQRIIRMSVAIATSLGIVMLPRIANMISKKCSKGEIEGLLKQSFDITAFISVACTIGIISIADNFVPWFFGPGYGEVAFLLKLTSFVCLFTALGGFFSNQYAIPSNNKKAYIIPVLTAAIISIILNLILGYKFGAVGSCVTILFVEFLALALRIYFLKEDLNCRFLFSNLYKYLLCGGIMYISIKLLDYFLGLNAGILTTIFEIIIGGIVYISSLLVVDSEFRMSFIKIYKKGISYVIPNPNR